ncbi:MAG: glycosyltransferase family 4 protein, partial [bacterium]
RDGRLGRECMTRVAMVTPDPPWPPASGGQLRMCQHAAVFRRLGTDVTVAAFTEAEVAPVPPGSQHLSSVRLQPDSPARKILRHLRAGVFHQHPWALRARHPLSELLAQLQCLKPDCVVLEYTMLASFLPEIRRAVPGVPVIVDAHNVESQLLADLARSSRTLSAWLRHHIELRALLRLEREMLPTADEVWVPSTEDALALRKGGIRRLRVVPNAVDTEWYRPRNTNETKPALVFVGTFRHSPNVEAAEVLCDLILPRVQSQVPGVHVYLVGAEPGPIERLAGRNVTVTGWVPDPRPYLARAAVVVVPLRYGSGTRLKILEAFAMNKAVVSTPKGCQGLQVVDGEHVLISDDYNVFAEKVIYLLRNGQHRNRLGTAARRLVEQHYSWDAVTSIVRRETLIGRLGAPASS